MGRVINPETPGKSRKRYLRSIKRAIYEYQNQEIVEIKRDLAAFIYVNLDGVGESVIKTTNAWENRDYWLKADRFRMEWDWVDKRKDGLRLVLKDFTEQGADSEISELSGYISEITMPKRSLNPDLYKKCYREMIKTNKLG